ncbi:MAG: hypothetical protein AB8F74_04450 [Saprospiraceae bacterium]
MAENKLNNFQQLQQQQITEHLDEKPEISPQIEMGVMSNMRTIGFMGDILELYIPRMYDIIISLFGGEREEKKDNNTFTKDQ